ncbi:MAG: hypothetical protein QOH89_1990 [Pseudonocardiales bacterium]|nr:hypothetical protein [Pseudonocardiales bacterium]
MPCVRTRPAVFIAALATVAGCSSGTTQGEGRQPKDAVPEHAYDASVYMCTAPIGGAGHCAAAASDAEVAAVRAKLLADPAVDALAYLSPADAVALYKLENPKTAPIVQVGDLPATFMVSLVETANVDDLKQRDENEPGVDAIVACGGRALCLVDELRRVGVVALTR